MESRGAHIRKYKKGDSLFDEGDDSASLFVVIKGIVSIQKDRLGETVELARILAGEVIGEIGFFDGKPRSALAVAVSDLEVIEIEYQAMEKICATIPPYMRTIMAGMAERLRKADHELNILKRRIDEGSSLEEV
jgi:CRP/FNR family cyclic AMP-dependent transcriptional regulator